LLKNILKNLKKKKEDHPLVFLYDSGSKDPIIGKIVETFGIGSARPSLVILNIQGQVKYVYSNEFTAEGLRHFIENYLAEKLTAIELG